MTAPAIEARSLSSLTTLASNPPSYPRNPTHVKHDPLVLYIARVPGSRDVFLTPMKPRERVVTAEDIQSSLYYIHVDEPGDSRLLDASGEPGFADYNSASADELPMPPIQRKAVPGPLTAPENGHVPRRKPIPRTLPPLPNESSAQDKSASGYEQIRPDYSQRHSTDSVYHRAEYEPPPPPLPPRRLSQQPPLARTSLTIIRRDPASSAQWNVAHIDDPVVVDVSSASMDDSNSKRRLGAPMYIEVTNPGYSKFLNQIEVGVPEPRFDHTSGVPIRSHGQGHTSQAGGPAGGTTFCRCLWMDGMRYANGGLGHRKNNSHDAYLGRHSPRSSFEVLRSDGPLPGPRSPLSTSVPSSDDQISARTSGFRGYVFLSPWGGRCEFLTGAGGGSLKCRHLVPGLQGAHSVSMPVSELRFNLPSSSKSSAARSEDSGKRSSLFHRPRHSRNNSSLSNSKNDVSEETRGSLDRMDLSLGQELAGGGFGGRQAKLGKLIIEDEGLKMMDLLVAANVALWWRAYERVEARPRSERGSV